MRKLLLLPIRFYQYAISPLMANHCRHYPSCSQYAVEAISHHGALKGLALAARRLLRCHPWAEGGFDPVPGTEPVTEPLDESTDQQRPTHASTTTRTRH